jgi:hypothetical protein
VTGTRRASGSASTRSSWKNSAVGARSTGRVPRSTHRASRQKGGPGDWSQPDGPGQIGLEAPPARRPQRHPTERRAHGGEHARFEDARIDARHACAHQGAPRTSSPTSSQAARRQGVQLESQPAGVSTPQRDSTDRSQGHRESRTTRALSMGRRENLLLASSLPPTLRPLRTPRRHPRLPASRHHPHLLQLPMTLLLGALSLRLTDSLDALAPAPGHRRTAAPH